MANLNELKDKALAAMGTIIDKSTELYGAAEEKAKYIAKTTKLKADIAKENADLKKLYADLGSLYYCIHKDDPEDGLIQICEEIKCAADKIEVKQRELESLAAEAKAADIEIDIEDNDLDIEEIDDVNVESFDNVNFSFEEDENIEDEEELEEDDELDNIENNDNKEIDSEVSKAGINEVNENDEDVIDLNDKVDAHLQEEYVSFSDNQNLIDELNNQNNDLNLELQQLNEKLSNLKEQLDDENISIEEKESLQEEYNDLKAQNDLINEQLEKNASHLDKLNVEKFEIQKISEYEMKDVDANIDETMTDFEKSGITFEEARDGKNSEEFVNSSKQACLDLAQQEAIVKSAEQVKFQEIHDYVCSQNMDRYEAADDPKYQQLVQEYRDIKDKSEDIHTKLNVLDANAMTVAYYQDIEYESIDQQNLDEHTYHTSVYDAEELGNKDIETVREEADLELQESIEELRETIENGIDDPELTNYFVDEVKANEVLENFKQSNWENLTIEEKKESIEKLQAYNQEILGIKDDIKIEYYYKEDESDFGFYHHGSHSMHINEYNLNDNKETADTIAHEMRHAYQYQRAEILENDRDIEFMVNNTPGNYIRPEVDFDGYRNQSVEKDAIAYGQRFKDYIDDMEKKENEENDLDDQNHN